MLKKQRLPPVWLTKMRPAGYFSQTKHLPRSDLKHSLQPSVRSKREVCDEQIISSSICESRGLLLSSVLFCLEGRWLLSMARRFLSCRGDAMWSSVVCGPRPVAMAIESLPSRGWKRSIAMSSLGNGYSGRHIILLGSRVAFEYLISDWNVLTLPDVIVDHRMRVFIFRLKG